MWGLVVVVAIGAWNQGQTAARLGCWTEYIQCLAVRSSCRLNCGFLESLATEINRVGINPYITLCVVRRPGTCMLGVGKTPPDGFALHATG